ncbi:hypothetical protein QR680_008163 [Steinernema hermaphroditum]|uniref:Uncharacterized protein n=1 Tax=Steinernema hermaphroditum TaxID=289476 RepID=A0AA39IHZ8_9BILA|nr:hypothetical protein QR680_008163 [Steinernema hermaphroditum]
MSTERVRTVRYAPQTAPNFAFCGKIDYDRAERTTNRRTTFVLLALLLSKSSFVRRQAQGNPAEQQQQPLSRGSSGRPRVRTCQPDDHPVGDNVVVRVVMILINTTAFVRNARKFGTARRESESTTERDGKNRKTRAGGYMFQLSTPNAAAADGWDAPPPAILKQPAEWSSNSQAFAAAAAEQKKRGENTKTSPVLAAGFPDDVDKVAERERFIEGLLVRGLMNQMGKLALEQLVTRVRLTK